MTRMRCDWALGSSLMKDYHDREWGVPVHDDCILFEFLTLEGFQAGLSWEIILGKRDRMKKAFDGFDYIKVAAYEPGRVEELLADAGIIRNRKKIEAAVGNARAFLQIREEFGSFNRFIWDFVGGQPIINEWKKMREVPAMSPESEKMSRALWHRGFRFVGPTICYAFMQAVGMVDDHLLHCFRRGLRR